MFLFTSSANLMLKFGVNDVGLVVRGKLNTASVPASTIAVVPSRPALSIVPA